MNQIISLKTKCDSLSILVAVLIIEAAFKFKILINTLKLRSIKIQSKKDTLFSVSFLDCIFIKR